MSYFKLLLFTDVNVSDEVSLKHGSNKQWDSDKRAFGLYISFIASLFDKQRNNEFAASALWEELSTNV